MKHKKKTDIPTHPGIIYVRTCSTLSKNIQQFPHRKQEKVIGKTKYTLFVNEDGSGTLHASEHSESIIRTSPTKRLVLVEASFEAHEYFEKIEQFEPIDWEKVSY